MFSVDAETFCEKFRLLQDCDSSLDWSDSANVSMVSDVCSALSYFKVCLTEILKHSTVQNTGQNIVYSSGSKEVMFFDFDKKYIFPTLSYFPLHDFLVYMLNKSSILPSGCEEFAKLLLDCLCLTIIFVDESVRIDLPFHIAGTLNQLKEKNLPLQKTFMNVLCGTIIPICFGVITDEKLYPLEEIPSIIILVLECVQDVSLHFQLIETLMIFKHDLWIDIMSVISYTDGIARVFATQLLFHYWPHFHSTSNRHKLNSNYVYRSVFCQHPKCQSLSSMNTATTMVLDAAYPTKISGKPPPLYLCNKCTEKTCTEKQNFACLDVIQPTQHIEYHCENKHCLAKNSVATVTLLGSKSTLLHHGHFLSQRKKHNISWHYDNRITRYCEECFNNLYHALGGGLNLAFQKAPTCAWQQSSSENTRVIVDAVISLLCEDSGFSPDPFVSGESKKTFANASNPSLSMYSNEGYVYGIYPCRGCAENIGLQSSPEMLSHFGVWLLISLCPPAEGIEHELASQLIASVLVWHKNTSRLAADECGNRLENLKTLYLRQWIKDMYKFYFKNFLNCLLPNPPTESRVKGYWDTIQPLWFHYKNGLNLITCLATYSVISFELWECLIPCWMTALCQNLESSELKRIEKSINILFDKDMPPFDFEPNGVFNFVLRNFAQTDLVYHENALEWLQILSEMKVYIPLCKLFEMVCVSAGQMRFSSYRKKPCGYNEKEEEKFCLPGLTNEESLRLIEDSSQPGVDSLHQILDAMNAQCPGMCGDSDCDNSIPTSMNENKKGLHRSGSSRASKRIKAAFNKPKLSLNRRPAKLADDTSSCEKLSSSSVSQSSFKLFLSPDRKCHVIDERKTCPQWNAARILTCYVDILDAVHQQLLLQRYQSHAGLCAEESMPITELLCDLLWQIYENSELSSMQEEVSAHVKMEHTFVEEFFEISAQLLKLILSKKPYEYTKPTSNSKWNATSDREFFDFHCPFQKHHYQKLKLSLQLLYLFNKSLEHYKSNRAVVDHVIHCLFLLSIHGEICHVLNEKRQPIVQELAFKILIPSLWEHLDAASPDSSQNLVAVLFNVLNAVESAWVYLFHIINSSFNSSEPSFSDRSIESWSNEFAALSRIHVLLMFAHRYKEDYCLFRSPVTHTISYVLIILLAALRRRNSAVHIKAKFIINTLSIEDLQVASDCLQFEFESSLKDRTFVISQLLLLHQLRPDSSPLSFSRFTRTINILACEAKSEKCFRRNVEEQMLIKSNVCLNKDMLNNHPLTSSRSSNDVTFNDWLLRAKLIMDVDADFKLPTSNKFDSTDQHDCHEYKDEDCDSFEHDDLIAIDINTTNHVMLAICRFLISNGKDICIKSKEFHTFFRQFQSWIGYSEQLDYFTHGPFELRRKTGIYTFLKNLPKILDSNLVLGNVMLPVTLSFLEMIVKVSGGEAAELELDLLLPVDQIVWLSTLQVLMYKYTFKDLQQLKQLNRLVNVCMNTLQDEFHSCDRNNEFNADNYSDRSKKTDKATGSTNPKKRSSDKSSKSIEIDVEAISGKFSQDRMNDEASPLLKVSTTSSNRQDATAVSSGGEDMPPSYEATVLNAPDSPALKQSIFASKKKIASKSCCRINEVFSVSRLQDEAMQKETNTELPPISTKCRHCGRVKKEYSVESLSMCVTNLCQFVRFNQTMAVPMLPKLLPLLALIAEPLCDEAICEPSLASHACGQVVLAAKQAIRCILHQLSDWRIFSCLFLIPFPKDSQFLRVLVACLRDYHRFHCVGVLKHALEDALLDLKLFQVTNNVPPSHKLSCFLSNLTEYLYHLRNETPININWQPMANLFLSFFNELANHIVVRNTVSADLLLQLIYDLLQAPILSNSKSLLLDSFSKILSVLLTQYHFSVASLYNVCEACYECFLKEKDKMQLTRSVVAKLIGALKLHSFIPFKNVLLLMQIVLLDGKSQLLSGTIISVEERSVHAMVLDRCFAMECMKSHVSDCLDVLGDGNYFENLKKFKLLKEVTKNEDSHFFKRNYEFDLKLAVAQIVAAQFHANYTQLQHCHNLFSPPSVQHGQKDYSECINQIKKLCWVLLGTLSHLGLQQGSSENLWCPIPFHKGADLAEIVKVVLTTYLERSKETKLNLTSLCYAFLFCQLWTIYCEQLSFFTPSASTSRNNSISFSFSSYNPVGDYHATDKLVLDFWSRVTPSIMVLLEKRGMVSENIRLHFKGLIKCLSQYDSPILYKLLPMWSPKLNQGKGLSNSDPGIPDIDSPISYHHESDEADQPEPLHFSSSSLVQSTAKCNARHVIEIVQLINSKLVQMETEGGLLCIV